MVKIEEITSVIETKSFTRRDGERKTYDITLRLDDGEFIKISNCKHLIPDWVTGSEIIYSIKDDEVIDFFIKDKKNLGVNIIL
jgi:hypothetical protein